MTAILYGYLDAVHTAVVFVSQQSDSNHISEKRTKNHAHRPSLSRERPFDMLHYQPALLLEGQFPRYDDALLFLHQ